MTDLSRREVGWVITDEEGDHARVGWGQLRVHADETEVSYNRVVGRTIFMDKSLTSHMIPEAEQVRWISASDDGDLNYEGIVRIGWLLESNGDDDQDLAYNIDRFCAEDAGDVQVWYSVDDMINCARRTGNVAWEDFAVTHPGPSQIAGHSGLWVQVYS